MGSLTIARHPGPTLTIVVDNKLHGQEFEPSRLRTTV